MIPSRNEFKRMFLGLTEGAPHAENWVHEGEMQEEAAEVFVASTRGGRYEIKESTSLKDQHVDAKKRASEYPDSGWAKHAKKLAKKIKGKTESRSPEISEGAVASAFDHEVKPWLSKELARVLRDLDKKVLAMGKGKWPTPGMEYAVTRYRPSAMTPEDFMDEMENHYLGWRNELKHLLSK